MTNYRDFLLLGKAPDGQKTGSETYHLAPSEKAFRQAATHPEKVAAEQGERFVKYLKRVMLCAAPLSSPQDVASFMASYARDAKARIEEEARGSGSNLPALASLRAARGRPWHPFRRERGGALLPLDPGPVPLLRRLLGLGPVVQEAPAA